MLGAPCLSPCSQHWRAGSGVACIQRAGGQVAVGLAEQGGTLLFDEHDLGRPVSDVPGSARGTAFAASRDGAVMLLGNAAGEPPLRRLQLTAGGNPSAEVFELAGDEEGAPVACIARQQRADVFGLARGRCAF